MPTNVTSVISHFPSAENGFTTTTSGSVSSGATTVGLNSVAGYTNGETVVFVIDPSNASKQTFTGVIDTAGVQVTSVVWTAGSNTTHASGATVVDYATATHISMVTKGLLVSLDQDGTLKAGAVDNAAALASNVVTTAKILDANVTAAKIVGIDKSLTTTDSNPYKFSAFLGTAQSPATNTKVQLQSELYDTNNNFDSATNFRYTAPVDGFYHFSGALSQLVVSGGQCQAAIRTNGTLSKMGNLLFNNSGGNQLLCSSVSGDIQLAASDYVELWTSASSTAAADTTAPQTYLDGFLVSRT